MVRRLERTVLHLIMMTEGVQQLKVSGQQSTASPCWSTITSLSLRLAPSSWSTRLIP